MRPRPTWAQENEAAHSFAGRAPKFRFVWTSGLRLCLLHLRHSLLPECFLPAGWCGGVLFRALEPVTGIEKMAEARGIKYRGMDDLSSKTWLRQLTSGPGRLCEAFGITRERDNGKTPPSARSASTRGRCGFERREVVAGPRIGNRRSPSNSRTVT